MTDTNLVQWNMRGFRSKYQHLRLLLTDSNATVTHLQECRMPHPIPCRPPGLDGLDHGKPVYWLGTT